MEVRASFPGALRLTYIPNDDCFLGPLDPCLKVSAKGDMIIEKLQQGVTLFFLVSNNVASD